MQVAIFDYELNQITIFNVPKEKEMELKEEKISINEYIESLPGFAVTCCYYMTADDSIDLRIGKQSDFPEYNG